jgi:hypothetical protein
MADPAQATEDSRTRCGPGQPPTRKTLRHAGMVAVVSFVWLLVVSSWMEKAAGGAAIWRDDVFFRSDTGSWLGRVVGSRPRPLPTLEIGAHPAALWIWRPFGRLIADAVELVAAGPRQLAMAGRTLVALVAAAGVAGLAVVAGAFGVEGLRLWILFGLYLLSSTSIIVALPEYFGVSSGLLSMFFAAHVVVSAPARRRWMLPIMGLLVAGTTISNAVLPLLVAADSWISIRVWRRLLISALVVSGPVAIVLVASTAPSTSEGGRAGFRTEMADYTRRFVRWQTASRLGDVLESAALSTVYPVVAPPESLWLSPRVDAVRMSAYHLSRYSIVGIASVLGWVSLLVASVVTAAGSDRRHYARLLGAWILFNVIFHSFWGDEPFLYSPHWSWALFGVVILGSAELPLAFVIASGLAIVPGQLQLLMAVRHLAATLH